MEQKERNNLPRKIRLKKPEDRLETKEKSNDTMPPVSPEIILLIETLSKQIQATSEKQERMHAFLQKQLDDVILSINNIDANGSIYSRKYIKEQLEKMSKDIIDIQKQLEEVRDAIIKKQEEGYKTMIRVQAAIIFLVISAIVTVLTKIIFHI